MNDRVVTALAAGAVVLGTIGVGATPADDKATLKNKAGKTVDTCSWGDRGSHKNC